MKYVSGQIYNGEEFTYGYLGFEEGLITDTGTGSKKDAIAKGIIIPTFANAHTHIGDAVIQDEIQGSLEEVVAPPSGLKHRVLGNTRPETMIETMRTMAKQMLHAGIEHFCDFREGGIEGVRLLKEALEESHLKPKILGRPKRMTYVEEEMKNLLESVDGIGLSSISDWPGNDLKQTAKHAKREKKSFALHASERVREDIDAILDLKPDFLIHMNEALDNDLEICAQNNVPIVVCPRLEVFFGKIPDIPRMLKAGLCLALGTDNAMLNAPYSILREMEFAYKISRLKGEIKAMDILRMVVQNPRKVLNVGDGICLDRGREANFIVFELPQKNPSYALVNGACCKNISMISVNGYIWTSR